MNHTSDTIDVPWWSWLVVIGYVVGLLGLLWFMN